MAKKTKLKYHVGGQQMPLLTPDSDWRRPTELPDLRGLDRIALDRETEDRGLARGRGPGWAFAGSPTIGGRIVGTSVAWHGEGGVQSFYAPTGHPDSENFDPEQVARWERDHQRAGVRFVMQNAPYDVGWGDADWRVPCPEKIDDVICASYMVDENKLEYSLDALCRWKGIPGKDEQLLNEALEAYGFPTTPKEKKQYIHKLPARYVGPYAEIDAVRTLQMMDLLNADIEEQDLRGAYQLEMDLLPVVHAMRKRGIRVDVEAAERAMLRFRELSRVAFADLSDKLRQTVSIDEARSNSWLITAFESCKVPFPRDERDGSASFEAKWMKNNLAHEEKDAEGRKRLVWDHWLPELVVRGKQYHEAAEKFIGTFVLGFACNGRLHASINQFKSEDGGTRTYRFSYADPPLQQMPNRDEEMASAIRGVFLPEEGDYWLSADYSQQEYRLIVHYAEKMKMRGGNAAADRYRSDPRTDFHSMVADMTGLDRKPAKDSNFAKSYGAGIKKFATMINKSVAEAEAIMNQYDQRLPFNKELNEYCQKRAERRGFIRLLDGARIHYDKWEPTWLSKAEKSRGWGSGGRIKMGMCDHEEALQRVADREHPWYRKPLRRAECRKAMNGLIQGGAARMTKMAMRAVYRAGHVPLIQMHDELGFSVRSGADGEMLTKIMREIVPLRVPMLVDAEYGTTWGTAKYVWDKRHDGGLPPARRPVRAARAAPAPKVPKVPARVRESRS